MINLKPYSSSLLGVGGFLLIAMGIYFMFLRPPLLPEDYSYIGTSSTAIQEKIPHLSDWLQKVFWVMGGYIFTSGLLTVYISLTSFRTRTKGAFVIVTIAGISSIVSMTVVNFMLSSDFRWVLLLFTLPWAISLMLYLSKK